MHFRRGLQLATDDFGRDWGTTALLRVYGTQVRDSASLPDADKRQLIADARSFVNDVLRRLTSFVSNHSFPIWKRDRRRTPNTTQFSAFFKQGDAVRSVWRKIRH